MQLVIDIGNTVAKMAAFQGEELVEVAYTSNETLEELPRFCAKYPFKQAIWCSVVDLPEMAASRIRTVPIPCLQFTHTVQTPVRNAYDTPETLGLDRLAAVVGAQQVQPGRDLLVIDAGTCVTYEFLDASGCYHGGNISPGLEMRLKAMHQFTSRLPLVSSEGELLEVGKSTETALRAGAIWGLQREIEGYVRAFKHKYPQLLVFLTGGCRFSFDTNLKNIIFADKFLVLRGLNRIVLYNNE
ncbi:MAG: type III pantothenate kinase [Bacteroides sp.]